MLILEDLSAEVPDTNSFHWDLKKFSKNNDKRVLMYGYNASNNPIFHSQTSGYKKMYFNNWAPCEFSQEKDHNGLGPLEYDGKFNIVYSICPYSVEWLNSLNLGREYRYIFYPFCDSLIPSKQEKKYDVIYHGGIHGKEHVNCLNAMKKYNYRYCTMTHHINNLTRHFLPLATDTNLTFRDKINLVAQSKISICYNLVHAHKEHIPRIKNRPQYKNNFAFSTIGTWNVKPQFKTRIHEAAISRTLNLVRKDEWNVVEDFYEPDKEFIYFQNEKDLDNKIKDILNNWHDYQEIIDNAYNKSLLYTTEKFIEKIDKETK